MAPLKILLVDDDALVRTGTADLLMDLGHAVIEAGSGEQALAHLRNDGIYDVVITDFSMPNMNGLELARMIHDNWETPIIVATGYGKVSNEGKVDVAWLVKPYSQDELAQTLEKALGRR